MYLTLLTLPLFASITVLSAGRKIGYRGVQYITTGSVIISAIMAIITMINIIESEITLSPDLSTELGNGEIINIANSNQDVNGGKRNINILRIMPWIVSDIIEINWSFYYDNITMIMCVVILSISALVHLFSIGYMNEDPHQQRYYGYLTLFTFFMLILVCSDNYLLMFVGWEGVGVVSYLLINFWFT
jgi:NADH-ubiquinone oxidoreductase chain 5